MNRMGTKKGFTLMELMVSISIIALLAAILMPALGNARELARAAECMSNQKNIGSTMNVAVAGANNMYPQAYKYLNGGSEGAAGTGGYVHWTAMIDPSLYPYIMGGNSADGNVIPKVQQQYVCPSHTPGGFAPANFTSTRISNPPLGQASEVAGLDDFQCPRISYVVNEAIMPRKKFSSAHDSSAYASMAADSNAGAALSGSGTSTNDYTDNLCLVGQDEILNAPGTILAAEFSENPMGILGSSNAGGAGFKSHRPTNAVTTNSTGGLGVFNAENNYNPGAVTFYQITCAQALSEINSIGTYVPAGGNNGADGEGGPSGSAATASADDHIVYVSPNTHKTGSNYVFCDGHAGKYLFSDTFNVGSGGGTGTYLWGAKMYSCIDKPVINTTSGN